MGKFIAKKRRIDQQTKIESHLRLADEVRDTNSYSTSDTSTDYMRALI